MKDEVSDIRTQPILRRALVAVILFSSSILHPSSFLLADSIWTGPPSGPPLIKDVKITRIAGEKIYFEVGGRETSRELDKVTRIAIDNEPILAAAEEAFVLEKYDAAVDSYLRLMRGAAAGKPWLTDWASRRLQAAAQKSGRFDAAASAYVSRVQVENPSDVPRPALPEEKSTYLDSAVADVNAALNNTKLTDDQRIALLSFLVDLQRARRDSKAVDSASDKLDEILAKDPSNPQASRAIARRKLQAAQAALDRKDFRTAISEIEANRAQISDPLQQADALWILAEARFQIAASARQTPLSATDAANLKDCAIGYMRVVAHFKDAPDRPHVAQALFRAAQVHELLGEPQVAGMIYGQLVSQYANDPIVPHAKQSIDRLRNGSGGGPSTAPTSQAPAGGSR